MAVAYKARGLPLPHLEAWRIKRAMNISELADKAGVSRGTIANAESGRIVGFPNIRKLAVALGVTVEQLQHAPTEGDA
jgi:transcriptional regulator with XRE-family HTH domain